MFQPLDQFELYFLDNNSYIVSFLIDILNIFNIINFMGLNNLAVYFFIIWVLNVLFISFCLETCMYIVPNNIWQIFFEDILYKFILNEVINQNSRRGQQYWLYISNLFFFILISNLIGSLPFSFALTSHIVLTFLLGGGSLVGLTIIGFIKQKKHFLDLFVPKGVPAALLPLLVFIESVSYIARGFSLSIRLFANIMSGHSLLHILLFFAAKILSFHFFISFLGLLLISLIYLLELGIGFLQAYVFTVLVSIYLRDSFEVGH